MRYPESATKVNDGAIHVCGELSHGAADLSAPVAVPAKQYRETRNKITDLRYLECTHGRADRTRERP